MGPFFFGNVTPGQCGRRPQALPSHQNRQQLGHSQCAAQMLLEQQGRKLQGYTTVRAPCEQKSLAKSRTLVVPCFGQTVATGNRPTTMDTKFGETPTHTHTPAELHGGAMLQQIAASSGYHVRVQVTRKKATSQIHSWKENQTFLP